MSFQGQETMILLKGHAQKEVAMADVGFILADWESGGQLFALIGERDIATRGKEHEADVERSLGEFKEVLEQPKSLPPPSDFDHRICLQDESKVVNVAPYWYAHYKKNELEKQAAELLES